MKEEKEIWRDIEGYKGLYMISNWGRVKSLERKVKNGVSYRTVRERILKPTKDKDGYLHVNLCKDRKIKTILVHRLVAMAWIPNPNGYKEVNHLSEDKTLNVKEGLEWCDRKYNNCYGSRNERAAKANTNGKCSKIVYQFSLDGKLLMIWPSVNEIQRQLGYKIGNISQCCLGKKKTAYKYKWSYTPINS